jgi:hypothetical protein
MEQNEQTTGFTIEQINRAVEAMVKAQDRAVKAVAQVIVMALWAANVNKDPAVANTLIANMRKGLKKQAVVDLLQACGNLAYVSGTFQFFDAKRGWSAEEVKVCKAAAAAWETFKAKAPEVKEVDAVAELETLLEKLTKKAKDGKLQNGQALVKMRALVGELRGAELAG